MKHDHRPRTTDHRRNGYVFDVAFDVILRRSYRRRIRRPLHVTTEPDSSGIRLPQNDVKSDRTARTTRLAILSMSLCFLGSRAFGQAPRINTFFPIGGKAGTTVEVELRGSGLDGVELLLANGKGISGEIQPGGAKVDETHKPLWQGKCGSCHELRSPANRSMTAAQWAATVDRMVRVRNAPVSADEQKNITDYLVQMSRAGKVTAKISLAPDARPGTYELRVVSPRGVSTAGMFEVGTLPEVMAVKNDRQNPLEIKPPVVVNGNLAERAERHFLKFAAKAGQRIVFNLKGYRFNDATQLFFNPNLRLYDSTGKEIAENHGYYDLDPLIDWTCPSDGDYMLEVRDLLGRGNPSSVYRLAIGEIPYDTLLYPPAAKAGSRPTLLLTGKGSGSASTWTVEAPAETGFTTVNSPAGPQTIFVTGNRVVTEEIGAQSGANVTTVVPATISGRLSRAGEADTYTIQGAGTYEFESIGARLGSPASPRLTLLSAEGRRLGQVNPEGRASWNIERGKTYSLIVEDATGKGGSEFVYVIEARPQSPTIAMVARPDNITVRPGMSTAVHVILTRREGGVERVNVEVTAEGLPAGVTAQECILPPDKNDGYLILTASPDAKSSTAPIKIVATAQVAGGSARTVAVPQDLYRLNNQERTVNRQEQVLAVRGKPEFYASFMSDGPLRVHPRKGINVKVKINRQAGFAGPVTVRLLNLPQGWTANDATAAPNTDEVTLFVRPNGQNTAPFLQRDTKLAPINAVLEAESADMRFAFGIIPVARALQIDD